MIKSLAEVIREVESGNNPRKLNFDILDYENCPRSAVVMRIKDRHQCSTDTARMIYACRMGAYQMRGLDIFSSVMESSGVRPENLFSFVSDVKQQDKAFGVYIRQLAVDFSLGELLEEHWKLSMFARAFHGPDGTDEYAERVVKMAWRLHAV